MTSRSDASALGLALAERVQDLWYAVELMFDTTPVRIWTGYGDRVINGNVFVGAETGGKSLLNVSGIQEVSDMTAQGAKVTFAGATSELISAALQENYQWRRGTIYLGAEYISQGDWIMGTGFWADSGVWVDTDEWRDDPFDAEDTDDFYYYELFSGLIDTMPVEDGGDTGSITVTIESEMVRLQRANIRRRTSASHKSRFSNDSFFDYVEALQNKEIPFGRQATQ